MIRNHGRLLDEELEQYNKYMFTSKEYFESSSESNSSYDESESDNSSARSEQTEVLAMMENRTEAYNKISAKYASIF